MYPLLIKEINKFGGVVAIKKTKKETKKKKGNEMKKEKENKVDDKKKI